MHRGLHELSSRATDAYEAARGKVARFLGAESADEIVFTRGTTEAINLVANAWGAANPARAMSSPSSRKWSTTAISSRGRCSQRTGAKLRFVPVADDGSLALDKLGELLTPEVKLFAFVHVSNSLGTINPAAELCRAARAVGAVTLVDGAQSAGHMPVDVQAIGCDFFAFSGHKICGPTGIGALYGRRELLEKMPPWHGGGEMIVSVTYERATYKQPPHKFEAGTPNIAGAIGLGAAIDYLEKSGRAASSSTTSHSRSMRWSGSASCRACMCRGRADARRRFVAVSCRGWAHPHDLTTFATSTVWPLRGGHHCNQPLMRKLGLPGTTRASFYFYNTRAEVDRMAANPPPGPPAF